MRKNVILKKKSRQQNKTNKNMAPQPEFVMLRAEGRRGNYSQRHKDRKKEKKRQEGDATPVSQHFKSKQKLMQRKPNERTQKENTKLEKQEKPIEEEEAAEKRRRNKGISICKDRRIEVKMI